MTVGGRDNGDVARLQALLRNDDIRNTPVVATKVAGPSGQMTWIQGGPVSLDAINIEEAINGSLQRLGCDYIDLYQIYWPDRVSLLAYSPLAMGLLSGKYMAADGDSKEARLNLYKEAKCRYDLSKPNLMAAVSAYVEIARKDDTSPVALAISFVLQHPLLMNVVIGATKVSQLKDILEAREVTITDETRSEIDTRTDVGPAGP